MKPVNREPFFIQPGLVKIIGVAGEAEHGKGMLARVASERFGYVECGFADPIKEAARKIFRLSRNNVYSTEGKASYDGYWQRTNREMLQKLGDDAIKPVFGREVWIESMHIFIASQVHTKGQTKFIISDLRFAEEIDYIISEMSGQIVLVNRLDHKSLLTEKEKQHPSEQFVREMRSSHGSRNWFHYVENTDFDRFITDCHSLLQSFPS